MSKNHPNDNIYSILGKLDALKPTPEEKRMSLVKEIQASVDAQGSITEGVSSVEAKLRKQLGESVAEGEVTRMPGKTIHRSTNAYGGGSDTQGVEFAKQKHHADLNKVNKPLTKSLEKGMNVNMDEKAPPGAKAERMVKGIKKSLSKDGHLSDKDKAIAYATTWKAHNKGQVEEAYNPVKAVKQCAKSYMEMNGIRSVHDLEAEDIESIGGDCQMNYQDVCEILGCNLPDSLGPVKSYDEHGDMEEGVCAECGMTEGECEHTMAEAEITRTDGKTTHRKTDFPGYPVDDADDIEDTNKGQRGRPRKHAVKAPKLSATGEKLGRGRPKKAAAIGSTAPKMHDPFGRVAHSASKLKGTKGRIHSLDEAMNLVQQNLTEGRYLEDGDRETLQHILSRFRSEVRNFEQGGDLDRDLYDALYDYYVECGEMPYGVQKARDDDPMNWVAERLDVELGNHAYGSDPANAEDHGLEMEAGIPGNLPPTQIPGKEDLLKGKGRSYYEEEVTMEDELNELAKLAGLQTEGNAFSGKLAHTAKGDSFEQDGETFTNRSSIADEELDEEETDEGNEFGQAVRNAKADGVQPGEKVEVGGKEIPVKESTMFDSAQDTSDFNISTSLSSDGDKNVTVTATGEHAANLLQMLRIAGLGGGQAAQDIEAGQGMEEPEAEVMVIDAPEEVVDEEGVEVDQPKVAPQNAPDEKYGTIKNITTQGDDLNREKKQDPGTANRAANPMTNAQQVLKSVAQLESKLAEEYESIKKVSK